MAQESSILRGQLFTKGLFSVGHGFGLAGLFFTYKFTLVTSTSFLGQSYFALNLVQNTQISIVHN